MIDHTSIAVKNYESAKKFYVQALAPLGYTLVMDLAEYKAGGFAQGENRDFWIGEVESPAGVHVAFVAKDKEAVHAFYDAALAAGGKDNGAPGYRTQYSAGYYGAFIHDADDNNVEAVWRDPSAV